MLCGRCCGEGVYLWGLVLDASGEVQQRSGEASDALHVHVDVATRRAVTTGLPAAALHPKVAPPCWSGRPFCLTEGSHPAAENQVLHALKTPRKNRGQVQDGIKTCLGLGLPQFLLQPHASVAAGGARNLLRYYLQCNQNDQSDLATDTPLLCDIRSRPVRVSFHQTRGTEGPDCTLAWLLAKIPSRFPTKICGPSEADRTRADPCVGALVYSLSPGILVSL